jgi:hypothetical protein
VCLELKRMVKVWPLGSPDIKYSSAPPVGLSRCRVALLPAKSWIGGVERFKVSRT